eukprot:m.280436 g.280436  ORF g.280436 m.280436 type:complete len:71 (+) comp40634_c0_seq59:2664-2876(+)
MLGTVRLQKCSNQISLSLNKCSILLFLITSTSQKMSNSTLCLDVKKFVVNWTFILLTFDMITGLSTACGG